MSLGCRIERGYIITVISASVVRVVVGILEIQILVRTQLLPNHNLCEVRLEVGNGRIVGIHVVDVGVFNAVLCNLVSAEVIAVGMRRSAVLIEYHAGFADLSGRSRIDGGLGQAVPHIALVANLSNRDHVVQRFRLRSVVQRDLEVAVETVCVVRIGIGFNVHRQPSLLAADLALDRNNVRSCAIVVLHGLRVVVGCIIRFGLERASYVGIPVRVRLAVHEDVAEFVCSSFIRIIDRMVGGICCAFQIILQRVGRQDGSLCQFVPSEVGAAADLHFRNIVQRVGAVRNRHRAIDIFNRVVGDFIGSGCDNGIIADFPDNRSVFSPGTGQGVSDQVFGFVVHKSGNRCGQSGLHVIGQEILPLLVIRRYGNLHLFDSLIAVGYVEGNFPEVLVRIREVLLLQAHFGLARSGSCRSIGTVELDIVLDIVQRIICFRSVAVYAVLYAVIRHRAVRADDRHGHIDRVDLLIAVIYFEGDFPEVLIRIREVFRFQAHVGLARVSP